MGDEVLTIIDRQYINGNSLVDYLKSQQQLSYFSEAENNFRKNILLSAASYFENEITEIIIEFAKVHSNNDDLVISIIKQKAVNRQYHTYFKWDDSKNGNSFFSLFGDDFKNKMSDKFKKDPDFEESIKAFYQIGQERNKMVHQNFAEIVIDKTAEEIYKLYQNSLLFIETLKKELTKND